MKVKVISIFRDKFTGKLYRGGEVLEIEDEARVADLVGRGLAIEETAPQDNKKAPKAPKNTGAASRIAAIKEAESQKESL